MRPALFFLASVAAIGIAACAATPPASTTDYAAIGKAIDSMDLAVQRWYNQEKVDSIVSDYYAPDAVVMFSNAPAGKGTDNIRNLLNSYYKTVGIRLHFERANIVAADSVASDQGHYRMELRDRTDTSKVIATDSGNYVTTFIKRNGQWRAIFDISTSEVPMPAPPPAPAAGAKKK